MSVSISNCICLFLKAFVRNKTTDHWNHVNSFEVLCMYTIPCLTMETLTEYCDIFLVEVTFSKSLQHFMR